MSPKHKLVTISWCIATMIATMLLSHGHLIIKEVLAHWPTENSWEGRLESALYTQGGLALVASIAISSAMLARGYFARKSAEEQTRKELAVRERHERAAAERHSALLESLSGLTPSNAVASAAKKPQDSGTKPR